MAEKHCKEKFPCPSMIIQPDSEHFRSGRSNGFNHHFSHNFVFLFSVLWKCRDGVRTMKSHNVVKTSSENSRPELAEFSFRKPVKVEETEKAKAVEPKSAIISSLASL